MYQFIYQEGKKNQPLFVALHGTGGTEKDLVPVAQSLMPEANVLGIRGDVNENGMLRFFKRKEEGVYDVEDLNQRGKNLYQFLQEKTKELGFAMSDVILLGFSNGSNIAINLLLQPNSELTQALLFAPMYPVDLSDNQADLSQTSVYLSMGTNDPIVSQDDSRQVIQLFEDRGADVETFWVNSHELTTETLLKARDWVHTKTK